ncbi:MAG: hypothetical protein CL402_07085 [Acidiferrobacteraceae bacterium]|nr:hypothetical protein [Acidiferrobacteraceae bacterium]|tara:strand:- start:11581 stop:12939 length:1359 start_codon:yes stop_codon:yes gene_type:complete
MDHQLELGVARKDITPGNAGHLAGDVLDNEHAVSMIHKQLFAQSLFLTDGAARLLLITIDVCKVSDYMLANVISSLSDQLDLTPAEIMIAASHTHSAPQTIEIDAVPGTFDREFVAHATNGMINSAISAIEITEPVTLRYETGRSDIGVNKRLVTPWGVMMRANLTGSYDPEVGVLIAERKPQVPAAIVCCYASHPVGHLRTEISSDLTGYFREEIESTFANCMAFHVLGCAGDVSPRARWNNTDYEIGNPHSGVGRRLLPEKQSKIFMSNIGKELASIAITCVKKQSPSLSTIVLRGAKRTIALPLQQPVSESVLSSILSLPFSYRHAGWAERMLNKQAHGEKLEEHQLYSIQIWFFSNEFSIIALEGEVFSDIGLRIKNLMLPNKSLVIGHANSYKGYIPTNIAIQEGGYEPESFYSCNLPAPYRPEMEDILIRAVIEEAGKELHGLETN